MIAEKPKSTPARHGFRKGCFYFRNSTGRLYRFRVEAEFAAEVLERNQGWRRMDYAEREGIEDSFWDGATRVELNSGEFMLFRSSIIERQTDQLCMPWAAPVGTRRGIRAAEHWERFLASWPAPLLTAVLQVRNNPLKALELFLQVPSAIDLAKDNPRLAGALSFHWEFPAVGRVDWDAVRQIVQLRRRAILGWLGFPATDAALNQVERMFDCKSAQQLLDFMFIVTETPFGPALSRTSGAIDSHVINLLVAPRTQHWLAPHRLKSGPLWSYTTVFRHHQKPNGGSKYFETTIGFTHELLEIGAIDNSGAQALSVVPQENINGVKLHPFLRPHTLPTAPEPITANVRRLDSLQALISESEAMQHCGGENHHLRSALRGFSAFYRVDSPVRATLALTKISEPRDGRINEPSVSWSIDELHGYKNSRIGLRDALTIFAAFPAVTGIDQWIHNPGPAN